MQSSALFLLLNIPKTAEPLPVMQVPSAPKDIIESFICFTSDRCITSSNSLPKLEAIKLISCSEIALSILSVYPLCFLEAASASAYAFFVSTPLKGLHITI